LLKKKIQKKINLIIIPPIEFLKTGRNINEFRTRKMLVRYVSIHPLDNKF